MTIRWGIIGAADFARRYMGPAIHAAKGTQLAALATFSPDKAAGFRAFCPELTVHDSYEALLGDATIDAVYIPLPNTLHVEWAIKALEAGKHVLCEKPLALRAKDIDPLIDARERTGLVAQEAYMIVHHPQWQKAKALYEEGAIGRLAHVQGMFCYNNPDPENIRNQAGTGGGCIPDIGVYTYGATRWLTGAEPEEITCADLTFENGVDVTARVSARFDGFSAVWMNSMRMHNAQEMVFVGDEGVLRLTAPFNANVFGEARVELHRGAERQAFGFPADNHYVLQVEAFCRTVTEGAPYPWSLEQARATQAMIDAIYEKAAG